MTGGRAILTLNTPLVAPVTAGTTQVLAGDNITFKLLATEIPTAFSVPGINGDPLYNFDGPVVFREVL